jgi:hypothetical protein
MALVVSFQLSLSILGVSSYHPNRNADKIIAATQAVPMTDHSKTLLESVFVTPGTLDVSAAALNYARDFIATVAAAHGDNYVATFDWSQSITARPTPDGTPEHVDDCLMLGAYERSDVPPEAIQTVDGVEFAIRMPDEVLQASVRRVIDLDKSFFFNFVLR